MPYALDCYEYLFGLQLELPFTFDTSMQKNNTTTRRQALKSLGLLGALTVTGASRSLGESREEAKPLSASPAVFSDVLKERIDTTPMVDAHEHLVDEEDRLANPPKTWIALFQHYLGDDFISAGLDRASVYSGESDPMELWRKIQPYWPAVKNTGYGRAVRITIRELYGIDRLDDTTVPLLQKRFEESQVKGLYNHVLRDHCNIESCQVDRGPYTETRHPAFLLQDINFVAFCNADNVRGLSNRVQVTVNGLNDWHEVIRLFFKKYAPYATAVKNQIAYSRGLNFDKTPAEEAEKPFQKRLSGEPLTPAEEKQMQDHLFWFCVGQANQYQLPVKLHTGYYVGNNSMPLSRLGQNPAEISGLCLRSPETRWMFMHTCYPYGDELISVAKHFSNAHVQMCWAWIIDPIGSKNFLKKYLVTAPANKIHLFGGDYGVVENVLGHARIARSGCHAALRELVEEGYLSPEDAMELVEPLLRGNAHRIFQLEKKYEIAKTAPWGVFE